MSTKNTIATLVSLFYFYLSTYFFQMTLSIINPGLWGFFIILGLIYTFINANEYDDDYQKPLIFTVITVVLFLIISFVSTSSMIHAERYRNLIGEVKSVNLTNFDKPIDPSKVILMDENMAKRLSEKLLSENKYLALGSQCIIGELTIQKIDVDVDSNKEEQIYYVAPLLHSGLFKYLSNKEGTTGYIMINSRNQNDVNLIEQDLNGNSTKIKYQTGAYFKNNIERYVYRKFGRTKFLTDYSFEVDDNLTPYYVITVYDRKIGMGGKDATGVVVVNANTGELSYYDIKDAPKWIDRIQPTHFISSQINDWGYYVHGWLNPSDKDRIKITDGSRFVYGSDGQCYFYTGLTSVGADEASIGYILVNTRTKESTYYKYGGYNEQTAMKSAEGAVQQYGYIAIFPRPYNFNGVLTYVIPLVDNSGLIKKIAVVPYDQKDIVGLGDDMNIKDAIQDMFRKINSKGTTFAGNSTQNKMDIEGIVSRKSDIIGKSYYIMIESSPNKMFYVGSDNNEEIILTEKGDKVKMTYLETGDKTINVINFDNLKLDFQNTESQEIIEKIDEKVKENNESKNIEEYSDTNHQ